MDAGREIRSLSARKNDKVFNLITATAGSELTDFILKNMSGVELDREPLWVYDWTWQGETGTKNANFLIDFRNVDKATDLNKHLSIVNRMLADDGIYIGCFESGYNRRAKILKKYNRAFAYLVLVFNYTLRNFIPIWKLTNLRTKKFTPLWRNGVSLAEFLGRMVYCGFEIINYRYGDRLTYFIARKKSGPRSEAVSTSRFIVKLKRIGKNGELISIYKIRSMYPFSEYIQDYVVKINGYNEIGKPKNDFRLTGCGRIIRKLWIDEIPQVYNLIKGDINIVGVRPISRYGYSSLPPDLQERRIRNRPGLIPPHVSLRLKGFDGVIKAERQYLEERERNPVTTKIKYFFLAVFNIVTFRVNSS